MDNGDILHSFFCSLPYINELLLGDVGVTLTDCQKYLLAKPGKKLDLRINRGDPLKPGSAVYRAIHENRRVVIRADNSLFGVAYIAVAIPLYSEKTEVIGAASIQESVDRQNDLKKMSVDLSDNISVVASTMEEITAQIQEIAATTKMSAQFAQDSNSQISETDQMLQLIKSITSQINLLGLNAAIESARVGNYGRGFSVVAQEIRNLAANSSESIKKIETVIKAVQAGSNHTAKQMHQIDSIISQITAAVAQVTGTFQQTSALAQELDCHATLLTEDQYSK